MATKKCINGHMYDAAIYGDHCPFCPPSESKTKVANYLDVDDGHTRPVAGFENLEKATKPTITVEPQSEIQEEGGTVIRSVGAVGLQDAKNSRQLVGVIVSFTHNQAGEVFNIYEGKNTIGRSKTCDIVFAKDSNISSNHLLILYREAEGVYWAVDQNSSNGTYINGNFVGDRVKLSSNDIIVIGGTKLMFIAIPQF